MNRQASIQNWFPYTLCRDLVLDCTPDACRMAPLELQLACLTELTRLVLKGHADHFGTCEEYYAGLRPGSTRVSHCEVPDT